LTGCGKRAVVAPSLRSLAANFRPFLTGSVPQTEFDVTHSKQTSEKFLTGARMHIRIFQSWPFTTQNPARRGGLARVNLPARRCGPARRGGRKRYVTLATSHSPLITDCSISTRFWQISRMRRNLLKTNAQRISTRGHNHTSMVTAENRNAEGCAGEAAQNIKRI
jgi:hypothetical protein